MTGHFNRFGGRGNYPQAAGTRPECVNLLYNLIYAIMTKTMGSPSHGWRGWQLPPAQAALPALPLCLSHSHETAKCRGDILKWSSVAERSFSFLDRVQMFVKPMP